MHVKEEVVKRPSLLILIKHKKNNEMNSHLMTVLRNNYLAGLIEMANRAGPTSRQILITSYFASYQQNIVSSTKKLVREQARLAALGVELACRLLKSKGKTIVCLGRDKLLVRHGVN